MTSWLRRLQNIVLSSGLVLVFAACSMFGKSQDIEDSADVEPQVKTYLDKRVSEAEKALEAQNFIRADRLYTDFESEFPHSIYLNRSKIGHGRALAGEGKYAEAVNLFREVIDSSTFKNPEIVALASYYASFSYEALGYDAKTFASLLDAEKLTDKLPPEISQAELPARLAAYYNRSSDMAQASKYFQKAEQGMAVLYQNKTDKNEEAKARTYYMMGQLSSGQISLENLQAQMDTLELVQVFSLRSIEVGHPVWSPKALENLQSNYRDIWNTIMLIPKNSSLDALAAEQDQKEAKFNAVEHLLEVLQKLKSFQSPDSENQNGYEKSLLAFLSQIEKQGQKSLASAGPMPLTPEAQKRQKLHREGVVHSEAIFPSEEKYERKKAQLESAGTPAQIPTQLPAKIPPTTPGTDPNLRGN